MCAVARAGQSLRRVSARSPLKTGCPGVGGGRTDFASTRSYKSLPPALTPRAFGGAELNWTRSTSASGVSHRLVARELSTSKSERNAASRKRGAHAADPSGVAEAAATYNLGAAEINTLAEKLRRRPEKVKRDMRQRGIQTVIEKCEKPGETTLQETIAQALWRLETSRALSDAIVETRR